jgi:hypothetical protein
MRSIKMLALTAIAALATLAFVAASSAMAESTALCDKDSASACPSGHLITHIHESTLSGAKAKVLSTITVECDVLFLGDTLSSLAKPLVLHGSFTYTNCGGCTVEETSADALVAFLKEGHETLKVTGEGTMFVDCGAFLECEYDHEGLVGTGKGPLLASETNGEVKFQTQVLHKTGGGFFCPKEAKLDITTTPESATYVEGSGVAMECKNVPTGKTGEWGAPNPSRDYECRKDADVGFYELYN